MRSALGIWAVLALTVLIGGFAQAEVKIVNGQGATLEDLQRERALVTVVLKGSGARDANLRVTGIFEDTVGFETSAGDNTAYRRSVISEIRVQDTRVKLRGLRDATGALTSEDKVYVNRAAERALDVFKGSRANQQLKMVAAMVLSASTHDSKANALRYLQELAAGNDVPTAIEATTLLYIAGVEPNPDVLQEGFLSGNRETRASAARLVGMTNAQRFLPEVRTLLRDPTVEIFPAAAKAVARMGDRKGIEEIYEALHALRDAKAEAAVFALSRLGGEDVRQRMLDMLGSSRGLEWFRVVKVLFALGDASATELMMKAMEQPAYERQAAILLAKEENWDAVLFLREYLEEPEDPNMENLVYRARVGAALYVAGDIAAKVTLQEMLDVRPNQIYARGRTTDQQYKVRAAATVQRNACRFIGYAQAKDLLSMLAGPMESGNPEIAIEACTAAMAIGNREFGERLREAAL